MDRRWRAKEGPGGHSEKRRPLGPRRLLRTVPGFVAPLLVSASAAAGQVSGTRIAPEADDSSAPRSVGVTAAEGLVGYRVSEAPRIDGRLDEPDWARAPFASGFLQQTPDEAAPTSERTEVRVLVGDEALYIGASLFDRNSDHIVARLARRDQAVQADWFYVFLDSYADRRTAFGFGVSAAGAQRDLRISEDDREDAGWDAVWESSVARTGNGWSVEMRIPLSQLRFSRAGEDTRWGLNFRRDIARRNEVSHWAAIPQGGDRFVSLFGTLSGLAELQPPGRLEILPHSVARLTRAPGAEEDPFHSTNQTAQSLGANLSVGLGSSLTLSASINPDFGQVEADPATVNLTAFETFQQERRPFFVEGSDIFTLSFPFWPPFFYSRRIGRSPQGFGSPDARFQDRPAATTILGSAKLSGKTDNGWSIGVLNALTGAEHAPYVDETGARGRTLVEPGANYSVARVAKELREGASGVGTMVTAVHRDASGTELNMLHDAAYGFGTDAFHRFRNGSYIANLSVLGSHVRGSREAVARTQRAPGHYFQRPDADHVAFDSTRTSLTGVSVSGRVQRVEGRVRWGFFGEATSPGYEINDLGFNPTLDYLSGNAWLRYEQFTPGRVFQNWSLGGGVGTQAGWDGLTRELTADLGFNFQLKNFWGGGVWAMRHRPAWTPTALRGGPALRRPGRWMGSFNASSDRRNDVSGDAFLFWVKEDESGGYDLNVTANLTVRPTDQLEIRFGPRYSRSFSAWQYVTRRGSTTVPNYIVGGIERRSASVSARVDYTFSPTLSLQVYARPFLAAGTYSALREVRDPGAKPFAERFRTFTAAEASLADGVYSVDRDEDGIPDFTLNDPSFNVGSHQMNTVLRWEYRPGSTLFAVWTHDRNAFNRQPWDVGDGLDRLFDARATNVFQLKLTYWLGL